VIILASIFSAVFVSASCAINWRCD